MRRIVVLIIIILSSYFTFSQTVNIEYKIYPIDETKNDTCLTQFVDNLKQVLIERDTFKLYKVLDERIVTSFGGAMYGKKDFISNWNLDEPDNSKIWTNMKEIIEMGGVFDIGGVFAETKEDKIFQFPYVTSNRLLKPFAERNPEFNFNPYLILICLNENIPLYKRPDCNSEIVMSLAYDILSMDYDKTNQNVKNKSEDSFKWIYVSTVDNSTKGWIANGKDFYFLGGRTMIIEKYNNNEYKITGFFGYD